MRAAVSKSERVARMGWHAGGGLFFFFQAEDGIRDYKVTGVQTCALPISTTTGRAGSRWWYRFASTGCSGSHRESDRKSAIPRRSCRRFSGRDRQFAAFAEDRKSVV